MHAAVEVTSLWLPILLSAVIVFLASNILHMVLPYHRSDWRKMPDETAVMEALGRTTIPPGDYMVPRADSMAGMKDPAFLAKLAKGPVFLATFLPPGPFNMGKNLLNWFLYCIVVNLLAGYVAGIVLGPGTAYMVVFRVVSTVAFAGYALAYWQGTIWYGRSASTTMKVTLDGLIYGLLTAGTFGWLWPRG